MKTKLVTRTLLLISLYLSGVNTSIAQDNPTTWREQMQFAKNKLTKEEAEKNGNGLSFINYTYKGIIDSETVKSAVLDSLISPNAPFPLHLEPVITRDTVYSGNSYTITEKQEPKFDIITVSRLIEVSDSLGIENTREQLRKELDDFIQIGFEYVEIEWDYKGKKITSICIVSDKRGGIVYEHIATRITESTSVTTRTDMEMVENNTM